MKFIVSFIFSITLLFSQENNVVKTSELELFLFKIGFESLLKDVEVTKDKSTLNEIELSKLNEKVELIMNEIYKDKRVLNNSLKESATNTNNSLEIEFLKQEIDNLKKEISGLKTQKKQIVQVKEVNVAAVEKVVVNNPEVFLRSKAHPQSEIVGKVYKNDELNIEFCDRFGWCKIKDKEAFIAKFTLKGI
ncbi:hypothetical protein GCM10012288_17000 [Malaciobacter pacificus]|uniref:Uncharacterized protein n=1 Tax=Malaciobacter pacificus TaxID=1080223 RepID=A0A5C2H7Y5_9BACT|nr:SH3 domain-containing protein [Malaciobacter pacificus]QEP34923.1 hypothetical protein APAC_1844 [Malaciobacter pacificus]GGD43302.1 hypothetical protein GCM10012288_17000 [Malaciobacter pacificus]